MHKMLPLSCSIFSTNQATISLFTVKNRFLKEPKLALNAADRTMSYDQQFEQYTVLILTTKQTNL